jgi:glycine/D-amino acid oxidase-like deaminating enzyme
MSVSRREFVAALIGAPALLGLTRKGRTIAGGFVDDGMSVGHAIRDRRRVAPESTSNAPRRRIPIAIVGGGIAGLSAAWELDRRGMRDFVLLELMKHAGGNARAGRNDVTAYPWAAHYVPVPGARATLVRELFEDLGVLKHGIWEERYLCFSPQERLFLHGEWRSGIEPEFALDARGREDFRRFAELVEEQQATGAFTIPSALGRPAASPLDGMSMAAWLDQQGLRSPALRWYVDYACRDDYGALAAHTSAWAGIHYFASREQEEKGPLTWPEGNGWIAQRLASRFERQIETNAPVSRIAREGERWLVHAPRATYVADAVIFAAPTFTAPYVVDGWRGPRPAYVYSPWLTANLTLERWPRESGRGAPPSWDNVIYGSPGLGYVVATHQSLRTFVPRTVWTYYWALAEHTPEAARQLLVERPWSDWRDLILADLERAHPDIRECVSRIDVLRMGHAMVRPSVGFLAARTNEAHAGGAPGAGFYHAHSDRSGLSLFEEAQYEGVTAARKALARVGRR